MLNLSVTSEDKTFARTFLGPSVVTHSLGQLCAGLFFAHHVTDLLRSFEH